MSDQSGRADARRRSRTPGVGTRGEQRWRHSAEKEQSATVRDPRLITFVALVACLAGLAAIAAGVFTVHQVDIVGKNLPTDTIVQTANVVGQNIFTVRSDEVVDRLDGIPSIQLTRVETSFPDRVTVYATPRQAVVGWRTATSLELVDRYGVVIGPSTTTTLPIIAGGRQAPDPATVAAVLYATSSLPGVPSGAIAGFGLDAATGLSITGKSGWRAVVGAGSPQDLVTRVATLAALLTKLGSRAQQVSFVDLRYKEPYLRYRGP